jgi:IclR family acetate operon transcriptional repressor
MLAMSESEQERIFAAALTPLTRHTITDHAVLRRELAVIKDRGYSLDNEEVVVGVHCVGIAILDRNSHPVGAISISGPSPKAKGPELDVLLDMLLPVCGYVSRKLGYTGAWPPVGPALSEAPRRRKAG